MDPATLALIALAGLVAFGIKRGSRPPSPAVPEAATEPSYVQASAIPSRLDGGGLRPAVTERKGEREAAEEAAAASVAGEAPSAGSTYVLGAQAEATGASADVVGSTSGATTGTAHVARGSSYYSFPSGAQVPKTPELRQVLGSGRY